jgi:hypothetical protein
MAVKVLPAQILTVSFHTKIVSCDFAEIGHLKIKNKVLLMNVLMRLVCLQSNKMSVLRKS